MCILWFIFTIVGSGCYNGWAKLGVFNECDSEININGSNNFGFARFLTIFEIFTYYVCIGLGSFNLYRLKVDPTIIEDTFEINSEMEIA